MAWQLSSDIEDALWRAAERIVPRRARTGRVLREAIVARSRRYTSERQALAEPIGSAAQREADLAARALFFTPADAGKVAIPLRELDRQGLLPRTGRLSIIDAGAGAGAMTLGLLDYLRATGALTSGRTIAIRAIDRDARALAFMSAVLAELGERWQVQLSLNPECADLDCLSRAELRASADLLLMGTVLNEVPSALRPGIVQSALTAIRPDGSAIIIEPALRATARDLHEVRDWLLETQLARVFAPCTRTSAPCPALADERDWCHEDRPNHLNPRTASLAGATGLRVHGLKFAYLTLRHNPDAQAERDRDGARVALRVVSRPRRQKGMRECFACGPEGRVRIRLLKRHRSAQNAEFGTARRGDILVAPARLAAGGDVAREDELELVSALPPL